VIAPALGLLEFDSIALGIRAGDAMAKRSPVEVLRAGTIHPGRYLVLVGGEVAHVEEALDAGRSAGAALLDELFLPSVHPDVVAALLGGRRGVGGEALGVVETATVAAALAAADAGAKGAAAELAEVRLADGLGGKGYVLFGGTVTDVEAAVEAATRALLRPELLLAAVTIAQLHPDMVENLAAEPRFAGRLRALAGAGRGE